MPEKQSAAGANRRPTTSALSVTAPRGGRPARRWLRPVTLLVTGTLVVLSIGWWAAPPSGRTGEATGWSAGPLGPGVAAASGGGTDTSWGPLTPLDADLLVRVRLACLWEQPAGEMAQTHTSDERVQVVGRTLAADHHRLDEQVRAAARKLQVELPDQPNLDQRGWIGELSGKRGHDFDLAFANRLRVAHGRIFAVVAEIRATTRNSLVRSFAQIAVDVVMKHMSLLESTGLVAPVAAASLTPPAPRGPITVPLVVTVVAIVTVANLAVAARRSWS
jgi:predicted outer membrane protein